MENVKPMQILLIEDDNSAVNEFKEYISSREDVKLIKYTNSSNEGIEFVKNYMPEGIILDLELHNGQGSGIEFLQEMKNLKLDFKPLIVVTTNVASNTVYDHIHRVGVDFIFYKKQSDYNVELVINSMVSLRETLYSENAKVKTTTETPMEREERIKDRINLELDLIGISNHLKGRKYLFDAILYLLEGNTEDKETVFNHIANLYKVGNSSVGRAMQTAINRAWRTSPTDELEVHYKARINYNTGVPSPTEFIYYYEQKIRKFV